MCTQLLFQRSDLPSSGRPLCVRTGGRSVSHRGGEAAARELVCVGQEVSRGREGEGSLELRQSLGRTSVFQPLGP